MICFANCEKGNYIGVETQLKNLKEEYKENPKNKLLKKAISRIENTLYINRNKVKACYGYTVDDLNVFEI